MRMPTISWICNLLVSAEFLSSKVNSLSPIPGFLPHSLTGWLDLEVDVETSGGVYTGYIGFVRSHCVSGIFQEGNHSSLLASTAQRNLPEPIPMDSSYQIEKLGPKNYAQWSVRLQGLLLTKNC